MMTYLFNRLKIYPILSIRKSLICFTKSRSIIRLCPKILIKPTNNIQIMSTKYHNHTKINENSLHNSYSTTFVKSEIRLTINDTARFKLRRCDYFKKIKMVWTAMRYRSEMRVKRKMFSVLKRWAYLYITAPQKSYLELKSRLMNLQERFFFITSKGLTGM